MVRPSNSHPASVVPGAGFTVLLAAGEPDWPDAHDVAVAQA